MNTTGLHNLLLRAMAAIAFLVSLALAAGCQKKCQQAAPTPFQHLRDTPWRLVETNNPSSQYKNLSRHTFIIMDFTIDFKGDVKKVVNNDQFDTPILTFDYNISPDDHQLVIRYSASGDSGGQQSQSSTIGAGTTNYQYALSTDLQLVDQKKGYFYRYVPFQGVVDPESTCAF